MTSLGTTGSDAPRRAVVLGGYGLIGAAAMRALRAAGFAVTGVGRSRAAARATDARADWVIRDIPTLTAQDWRGLLDGVDVVVNASGALQDGARDDLEAIHVSAIARLVEGAAGTGVRIVQISAAGVSENASTAFFRSKARGDAILAQGAVDWVILRPTLVLAPNADGGTALLRAAAALPLILPRMLPEAQVQTVHIEDLCAAITAAARGQIATGTIADLTEAEARPFPVLLAEIRRWQGWPQPAFRPAIPGALIAVFGRGADLLGHLGWRSPLRTTALQALSDGIRGDPAPWIAAGGAPCRALGQTLASLPATRQERLFARAYIALPVTIATLALFWCLSGAITLLDPARAIAVLAGRGSPGWLSDAVVIGGALADLALGLGILWRRWTKAAALGMLALSAAYVIGSLIVAPDLWA
ncbi:SDR family oxidoreductase, partial [Thioclava sp. BHET1]